MNNSYEANPRPTGSKGRLVVPALFFTGLTLTLGTAVMVAWIHIISGETGYIIMFTVAGLIGLLCFYHARHYLMDLKSEPIVLEGEVIRKWHKANFMFFLMPSYYIQVADRRFKEDEEEEADWGKIINIKREDYARLLDLDLVRITCFPHTLSVELVELYDETRKTFVPASEGTA